MMMTEYQKTLVEQNMGLVDWVLRSRINVPTNGIFTYDECYAIGCEALCKAAMAYQPSKGEFDPFACLCIYNAVLDRLRKEGTFSQHRTAYATDDDGELAEYVLPPVHQDYEGDLAAKKVSEVFRDCKARYSGIVLRGIEAIELKALGYSTSEIAEKYGTNVHNVNAWISKARKKLYAEPEFMAAIS